MRLIHAIELLSVGAFAYASYDANKKAERVQQDANDPNQIVTRQMNLQSAESLRSSRNTYAVIATGLLGLTIATWKNPGKLF